MRAIDVCAGAGGFSLGLSRAGFDVLGVELDSDAIDTHRRHAVPPALAAAMGRAVLRAISEAA